MNEICQACKTVPCQCHRRHGEQEKLSEQIKRRYEDAPDSRRSRRQFEEFCAAHFSALLDKCLPIIEAAEQQGVCEWHYDSDKDCYYIGCNGPDVDRNEYRVEGHNFEHKFCHRCSRPVSVKEETNE